MPYDNTGRRAQVAQIMADGDQIRHYSDGSSHARHITSDEIAARIGTSAANVRQIWARIRADLGPQAR